MYPIITLLLSLILSIVILSWSRKLPPLGQGAVTFFLLALALFTLTRGGLVLAAYWGLMAWGNWTMLQKGRPQTTLARPKRTPLPGGCPPHCAGLHLEQAELAGVNLRGANLSQANLSGANLYRANLARTDLSQANLFVANLEGVNLREANLNGGDLGGADLRGADMRRANLEATDLRGAKYDDDTLWPTNFDPGLKGAIRKD